jgi:hypothetical protein
MANRDTVERMEQTDFILALFRFLVVAALLLFFWRHFRGGRPPNPMHPSPADDSGLLRRRRSKVQRLKLY